jgi:hypothetical protein
MILFDMVRSMMTHTNLPISFWGDTLLTATYILNLSHSSCMNYEIMTNLI